MKPTKSRVYCRDGGRMKILFETEKKAETFIKFNSEEIEAQAGYSPNRSYYCIICNGWHVTSKKEDVNIKSKTETVLRFYTEEKARRQKAAEIRKSNSQELRRRLDKIEQIIASLATLQQYKQLGRGIDMLNTAFEELSKVKTIVGSVNRKKIVEAKLTFLRKQIENLQQ